MSAGRPSPATGAWAAARGHRGEPTSDAALVRHLRRRLLLWSGGSTLLILVALGAVLYAVVANALAAAATEQLRERASTLAAATARAPLLGGSPFGIARSAADPGVLIGGTGSGTIAFLVTPNGKVLGANGAGQATFQAQVGSLVDDGDIAQAASTGREVVSERAVAGTTWRLLTIPIATTEGTLVIQVVGDRSDEDRTLAVLFAVLVVGGLAALGASLIIGRLYADRAITPIRTAMHRQREFAADASHELRTPLAVVRASIEHLRRHRDERVGAVGTALDDIEAGSDQLTKLVDDLLLLARTDSGAADIEPGPADLGDIAIDAVGSLAGLAEDRGVTLALDAEPVPLTADPARLRQLVVILVDNAIRHAAAGGGHRVAVAVRGPDSRAVLTVDDDGPGIREIDLAHVFDRFWRAPDAAAGGTGLGLAIARWIVERHGGSIAASNRPDRGARFLVELPRRPSRPAAGA
jgi:signal transduction histidine kinase